MNAWIFESRFNDAIGMTIRNPELWSSTPSGREIAFLSTNVTQIYNVANDEIAWWMNNAWYDPIMGGVWDSAPVDVCMECGELMLEYGDWCAFCRW